MANFIIKWKCTSSGIERSKDFESYSDAHAAAKGIRDTWNCRVDVYETTRINFFDPDLTNNLT